MRRLRAFERSQLARRVASNGTDLPFAAAVIQVAYKTLDPVWDATFVFKGIKNELLGQTASFKVTAHLPARLGGCNLTCTHPPCLVVF